MDVKKIIHIDMDAFYASVEQRDNPELRGKPVVVGGAKSRGVVAAASYEARRYGVHSAMPSQVALRKCPSLVFVPPRFKVYQEISRSIREIFYEYTNLVEPLSLDEAYLDVTDNKKNITSAMLIAQQIKNKIRETTSLTASAGISYNKFLAKIASDYKKPNGFMAILPEHAQEFLLALPIEKFYGIGKVTAEKMKKMNVYTGYDLRQKSLNELAHTFGKAGRFYYYIVRGIDQRMVNPDRIRKSVGAERTFEKDLKTLEEVKAALLVIAGLVSQRVQKNKIQGKTITLKVKFYDFEIITKRKTLDLILKGEQIFYKESLMLFERLKFEKPIRLLGVSLSNLYEHQTIEKQLEFNFDGF